MTEPTNPYGASKLAADRAVADVAATGEIGAISLRAFNISGGIPGCADKDETRLIPKIVAVIQGRADGLAVNGDGSVVRDYVHVADMADAFVRALDAAEPGTLDRLQRRQRADAARSPTSSPPPRPSPARSCRCGTTRRPTSHASCWPTRTRIRAELGWRPRRSKPDAGSFATPVRGSGRIFAGRIVGLGIPRDATAQPLLRAVRSRGLFIGMTTTTSTRPRADRGRLEAPRRAARQSRPRAGGGRAARATRLRQLADCSIWATRARRSVISSSDPFEATPGRDRSTSSGGARRRSPCSTSAGRHAASPEPPRPRRASAAGGAAG